LTTITIVTVTEDALASMLFSTSSAIAFSGLLCDSDDGDRVSVVTDFEFASRSLARLCLRRHGRDMLPQVNAGGRTSLIKFFWKDPGYVVWLSWME
jgi:hypothetical protein